MCVIIASNTNSKLVAGKGGRGEARLSSKLLITNCVAAFHTSYIYLCFQMYEEEVCIH